MTVTPCAEHVLVTARRRERTGILVIRIWVEHPSQVRARITHTIDVASAREVTRTALSPAEISDVVSAWLEAFSADDL